MRVPPAQVAAFLRQPDEAIRAVLLYGPDSGLVRERADMIAKTVCAELSDPFRVAELSGSGLAADPARLPDEAAQLSLVGGRRVIRVREAGDAQARLFAGFLDNAAGDALVVVEAAELSRASPLRLAFERAKWAAAIGCYPDAPRDLAAVIRDGLRAHRVTASADAVGYLVEHLGGDRLMTRAEIEKLALFAGEGGRIGLDDAMLSVGDSAAIDLDDAVMAAADGDAARLDRALERVLQQGISPVTVIRAALRHLQRLHGFAAQVAGGASPADVLREARPPIFFKHQQNWERQLARWSEAALRGRLGCLMEAEADIKQTALPAETICRAAFTALAEAAAAQAPADRRTPR